MIYSTASLDLMLFVAVMIFIAGLTALFFGSKRNHEDMMSVGLLLLITGLVAVAGIVIKLAKGHP